MSRLGVKFESESESESESCGGTSQSKRECSETDAEAALGTLNKECRSPEFEAWAMESGQVSVVRGR